MSKTSRKETVSFVQWYRDTENTGPGKLARSPKAIGRNSTNPEFGRGTLLQLGFMGELCQLNEGSSRKRNLN